MDRVNLFGIGIIVLAGLMTWAGIKGTYSNFAHSFKGGPPTPPSNQQANAGGSEPAPGGTGGNSEFAMTLQNQNGQQAIPGGIGPQNSGQESNTQAATGAIYD